MLQVGNKGMSYNEEVSHFSLWAALKSPLLISTDLATISEESLGILKNEEVIAINQDVLGKSAHLVLRVYERGCLVLCRNIKYEIWVGELEGGAYVVSMSIYYFVYLFYYFSFV